MADLPPDAVSYRIAAVVPCMDTRVSERGWPCWEDERDKCWNCLGDGTRAVVTDVEVEPAVFADDSGGTIRSPSNMRTTVWREVPRG